jgi:hypothetical protein
MLYACLVEPINHGHGHGHDNNDDDLRPPSIFSRHRRTTTRKHFNHHIHTIIVYRHRPPNRITLTSMWILFIPSVKYK